MKNKLEKKVKIIENGLLNRTEIYLNFSKHFMKFTNKHRFKIAKT